ncbi:MAG: DUF2267 domain-containing protein [Bacteroidota bacterium]
MKYEQYAHEAHKFVKEVASELGDPANIDQADRIMVSVLHTLRDLLSPEESLHLISQLPMILKAIYVNGWHLSSKNRIRSMDEFVECLMLQNPRTAPQDFGHDEKAIERTKAVIRVLRRHVSIGEIKDIVDQLPAELIELWLTENEQEERYHL